MSNILKLPDLRTLSVDGRTRLGSNDQNWFSLAEKDLDQFETTNRESAMRISDLEGLQFDELWLIHEQLTKILSDRMVDEKRELEERLAKLNRVEITRHPGTINSSSTSSRSPRRKYPKVLPKYFNPLSPSETWSGRGKQPRWLVAALKGGHKLDEFKIGNVEKRPRKNRTATATNTSDIS
jgi:DNA-binding protein H-NS